MSIQISARDAERLREIWAWYKKHVDDLLGDEPPNGIQTPDIMVARATEKIDGMVEDGETDDWQVSSGTCEIFRITDVPDPAELEIAENFEKEVFNTGPWSIADNQFIIVARTKSGKWVVVQSYNQGSIRRFEMGATLSAGGSAEVGLLVWTGAAWEEDEDETTFTVHDFQNRFSKMLTTSGDAGALGIAQYMTDKGAWEILDMQIPGDFFGILRADLAQSVSNITVDAVGDSVMRGYDVFGVNHGSVIQVWNPVGSGNQGNYWFSGDVSGGVGDRVWCRWDVNGAKYWIADIEPNSYGWQTLDVVTAVNFGGSSVTTKQIELPPWTTIT